MVLHFVILYAIYACSNSVTMVKCMRHSWTRCDKDHRTMIEPWLNLCHHGLSTHTTYVDLLPSLMGVSVVACSWTLIGIFSQRDKEDGWLLMVVSLRTSLLHTPNHESCHILCVLHVWTHNIPCSCDWLGRYILKYGIQANKVRHSLRSLCASVLIASSWVERKTLT